jgi:acetoin utilization deacetylase AcuC-like enzyme
MAAGFAPRPGRLVLFLEGGYDLRALRMSVATTLGALLGAIYQPEDPTFGGPGAEMVDRARREWAEAYRRAVDPDPGFGDAQWR